MEFKLYDASTGGTAEWTEDYTYDSGSGQCSGPLGSNDCRIRVADGYLSANLGSITAFPSTINWDQQQWLTMNIGGTTSSGSIAWDGEMSPRLGLTAVPYAFRSGQLAQYESTPGSSSILSIANNLQYAENFVIPDQGAAGTYNLLTGTPGIASTTGVQLQSSTPGTAQSGNFNISGTGVVATSLLTPSLDTPSSGTLSIGSVNATAVDLNQSTVIASNKSLTADGSAAFEDATNSTTAFQIQNALGTSNLFLADTTDDCIGIRGACSGNASALYIPWISGDGKTTLVVGSGNSSNNQIALNGTSYSNYGVHGDSSSSYGIYGQSSSSSGVYGYSSSGPGVFGNSSSGAGIEGSSTSGISGYFAGGSSDTSPTLDVQQAGSSTANLLVVKDSSSNNMLQVTSSGALTSENDANSTTAFQVQNAGDANTVFDVDTTNGRVGIGTNAPNSALEVYQNTANDAYMTLDNAYSGKAAYVRTFANSDYSGLQLYGTTQDWAVGENGSTSLDVTDINGGTNPFSIQAGSATNTLTIDSAGVGINTTSSNAALTVAGDLSLTGAEKYNGLNYVIAGTAGWFELGVLTLPQNGYNAEIKIYAGAGYNASATQNGYVDLFIRTSNGSGTGPNGFGANGFAEAHGTSNFLSSIELVSNAAGGSATSYTVYADASSWIGQGFYTVQTNGGSWASDVTSASSPGAGSSTVLVVPFEDQVNDAAIFKDSTNSLAALQVQNAAGTSIVSVDTTDGAINVNATGDSTTQSIETVNSPAAFTGDWFDLQENGTSTLGIGSRADGGYYEPVLNVGGGDPTAPAISIQNSNGLLRILPYTGNTLWLEDSESDLEFSGFNGSGGTEGGTVTFDYSTASFSGNLNVSGTSNLEGTVTSGTISAIEPGTTDTTETWHTCSGFVNGWGVGANGYCYYRLDAMGDLELNFVLNLVGTRTDGTTVFVLPSGYYSSSEYIRAPMYSLVTGTESAAIVMPKSGSVELEGIGGTSTTQIAIDAVIPISAP